MPGEWYCQIDNVEYGPLSAADLKRMAEQGTLGPANFIKKMVTGKWIPARQVKGLNFKSPTLPGSNHQSSLPAALAPNNAMTSQAPHSDPNYDTSLEYIEKAIRVRSMGSKEGLAAYEQALRKKRIGHNSETDLVHLGLQNAPSSEKDEWIKLLTPLTTCGVLPIELRAKQIIAICHNPSNKAWPKKPYARCVDISIDQIGLRLHAHNHKSGTTHEFQVNKAKLFTKSQTTMIICDMQGSRPFTIFSSPGSFSHGEFAEIRTAHVYNVDIERKGRLFGGSMTLTVCVLVPPDFVIDQWQGLDISVEFSGSKPKIETIVKWIAQSIATNEDNDVFRNKYGFTLDEWVS